MTKRRDTSIDAAAASVRDRHRRLSGRVQGRLMGEIRGIIATAPLYTPCMPRSGRPLSVRMTNCGPLGWVTDKDGGYRYQPSHPETGRLWPPIPEALIRIWHEAGGYGAPPEACLINYYGPGAKLGLHRDEDEEDFAAPVVSISLGDSAVFRLGGARRKDESETFVLESGDVMVLSGTARRAYHGIDRLLAGTSDLLPEGGRFNLTLRRVTKPEIEDASRAAIGDRGPAD